MSRNRQSDARQGMVLIVVLVVVVLLSLAAYAFVDRMAAEQKAERLNAARVQCRLAAESGAEYVARRLSAPSKEPDRLAVDLSDNAAAFCAVPLLPREGMSDEEPSRAPRFTVIAPPLEAEATAPRYGVIDESAKLNLHALVSWDAEEPGAGRRALLAFPEMTPSIADRILDYVDTDSEPREQGFEADVRPPLTVEGLLSIEGITPALLQGHDRDRNGRLDAAESGATSPTESSATPSSTQLPPGGWSTWLTLQSAESALTAAGAARIDLNSDDLPALHAALVERFDEEAADFVVAFRQYGSPTALGSPTATNTSATPAGAAARRRTPRLNARSAADTSGAPAESDRRSPSSASSKQAQGKKAKRATKPLRPAEIDPASAPATIRLRSAYDLLDAVVEAPATPQRAARTLRSPWQLDRPDDEGDFTRLLEETSTQAAPIVGRVNLLQAPRIVLEGAGLEPRVVEAVLDGRGGPNSARSDRKTLLWLVREKHIELAELRRLAPRLTTGGQVASAQVIGFVDARGPVERYELLVDATVRPPRQLSWKSLVPQGRGYPASVLDPLSAPATAAPRTAAPASPAAAP